MAYERDDGQASERRIWPFAMAFLDDKQYAAFLDKIDGENKSIMADLGLMKK